MVHILACQDDTITHMKITIITLFPEMMNGVLGESIMKRAVEKQMVQIEVVNLREFATDSYRTVDDRPYGGGAGMVLKPDVLSAALSHAKQDAPSAKTLLTSAKGVPYTQSKAQALSLETHLIIVCGHYEGVDERIMSEVDEEISLGDFVMTGGEIAAAAVVDSVVRLLPGVLKKDEATAEESFMQVELQELIAAVGPSEELIAAQTNGQQSIRLLEYPHYTRPEVWNQQSVPEVLLCGDPKKIRIWKLQQAYAQTKKKRPDLLSQ